MLETKYVGDGFGHFCISNILDEFEMLSDVSCCTDSIFMTEDHDVSCSRACSELTIDHCYEFDSRTCQGNCSLCNGE